MYRFFIIALALIYIGWTGCSSSTALDGEVFLDGKDQVTRLALVDVQIISESQFISYVKLKLPAAEIENKRLADLIKPKDDIIKKLEENINSIAGVFTAYNDQINKYSGQLAKIQRGRTDLISAERAGLNVVYEIRDLKLGELDIKEKTLNDKYNATKAIIKIMESSPIPIPASIKNNGGDLYLSLDAAKQYVAICEVAIKKLTDEIKSLKDDQSGLMTGLNGKFYYDKKIDNVINSFTTNSDGKFKATIEGKGKYVVLASKDNLRWITWLPLEKSEQKLTLSNKNLADSGCGECVFNSNITPKKLVQ